MRIVYAYLAYFSALYTCAVLWTYAYLTTATALAIAVVALHFVFGALALWNSGSNASERAAFAIKRYTQPTNFAADTILIAALVSLALSFNDNTNELLYVGVGLATAGNSLCILAHLDPASVIALRTESHARARSSFYLL